MNDKLLNELKASTADAREHLQQMNFVTGASNKLLRKEIEAFQRAEARFDKFLATRFPVGCKVFVRVSMEGTSRRFSYVAGTITNYSMPAYECVVVEVREDDAPLFAPYQQLAGHPRRFRFDWKSIERADEIGFKL